MRVLALGAFDVPYIRDNWADALRHVLKDDVTCVNASAWLACGPRESHLKSVYRLLANGAYDYLFLYHDYIFSDFPEEFFAFVRSAGVRTITFHPDDEPEVWYQRNRPFDGRYDLVASHARRGVWRRIAENRPTQALYLPWGFNPRFFDRPSQPLAPRYDVVFIGKSKVHEHDQALFKEDGRHRDHALHEVASLCARRGWRFGLFGYGWDRHPTLARHAGGLLSHGDMVRTYHEARIVFNPGWTADDDQTTPQTKLRHFEVPGCGAFQLTNENPELAELLEPEREVALYSHTAELCDKIAYYLAHDDERRAIADAGYRRVHAEHTLDHRVRTLFTHARTHWPPIASAREARPMPRVRTFTARSIEDVRAIRDRLVSDPALLQDANAVHVLACDGAVTATNYSALRDWWRAGVDVFAGRCFYQLANPPKNPLQPQRSELAGGFLHETVSADWLAMGHRTRLPEALPAVRAADRALFLLNFIARPSAVVPLLDAFLAEDLAAIEALNPLPTGIVLTEVRVDLPHSAGDAAAAPSYMGPLRTVLRQAAALDQTVAIYGARGEMAETVFDAVRATPNVKLVALFDRAMAGRDIGGVPVYSSFELPTIDPDVLLVAAAYSGPTIYEQLKPLEPRMAIVPLYDLQAPVWNVLVP